MRILAIHEKTVPLSSPMRNASIDFGGMTASAVAIVTDRMRHGKPVVGLAFDSIGRYGHGGLLRERFIPRLLAAAPDAYADETRDNLDPFKVWSTVMRDEKPGGHGERPGAVGLVDAAIWDLVAKIEEKPLWRVLAERFHPGDGDIRVPVYSSGGHYRETDDLTQLQDELRRGLALGHTRAKIKIGGAPMDHDRRRIEAAIAVLGSGAALAVDCNGTLPREAAFGFVDALRPYGLGWIEEPVDPLDYALHAELAAHTPTALATGENLFSAADGLNLVRHGGLRPDKDLLQIDISLSYGIVEYLRILGILEAHGWSRRQCYPHAGHLLAFNVVAGLGLGACETSFGGSFPIGLPVEDGHIRPDDLPGVGFERTPDFAAIFAEMVA